MFPGGTSVFFCQLLWFLFSGGNLVIRLWVSRWGTVIQIGPVQFNSLSGPLFLRNTYDEQALVIPLLCVPVAWSEKLPSCEITIAHSSYFVSVLCKGLLCYELICYLFLVKCCERFIILLAVAIYLGLETRTCLRRHRLKFVLVCEIGMVSGSGASRVSARERRAMGKF